MAVSTIKNESIKLKHFTFSDLSQYSPSAYYLAIDGLKAKAGLPSSSRLINVSLTGWAGLGTAPNVELGGDDNMWVFYSPNTVIASTSYVTVRFAYI